MFESTVGRTFVVLVGVGLAIWLLSSAVRTLVIPRPEQVWLTSALFRFARYVTVAIASRFDDPGRRHWLLGSFAPVVLISLPLIWSIGLIFSFGAVFWGLGGVIVAEAIEL